MAENNDEQIIISKWDEIRQNLQQEFAISGISYRTWIEPLTVYSVSAISPSGTPSSSR